MSDLFSNKQNKPTGVDPSTIEDPLAHLVGEDKKFKTAIDLARGKLEADSFIERLLQEKRELEEDLQNRIKYEDYLAELDSRLNKDNGTPSNQPNKPNTGERNSSTNEGSNLNITQEDLESLVVKMAEKTIKQKEQDANVKKAQDIAQEILGENYGAILRDRAASQGLDEDLLNELARRNPTSFLNVLGVKKEEQTPNVEQVKSNVFGSKMEGIRTPNSPNNETPKMSDFTALRKTDPKKYWSAETQRRIFELTKEHGEAFLKS